MQLKWLRAGCASIAECGEYTVQCYLLCNVENEKKWVFYVYRTTTAELVKAIPSRHDTRESAEAACEAWLDQHDKPVWHDATEWLSWAEWREWRLIVRPSVDKRFKRFWQALNETRQLSVWDNAESYESAKAAAERYVREQTGGAA